jgi:hypothetical protein
MSLFNFFRRNKKKDEELAPVYTTVDRALWTGKDFEFLITGDINIPTDTYDSTMTPNSFEWIKIDKNNWTYYQVGDDEFSYSWEMPGIQMTFSDAIPFQKAKKIADEVIENLKMIGQMAELVVIDKTKVYRFDK